MMVELGLVEQRLKPVHEVFDAVTVTDVAKRNVLISPNSVQAGSQ